VSLYSGNFVLAQSAGEVLFTEYGVSGPAIFEISRHVCRPGKSLSLHFDLMPEWEEREVFLLLRERRANMEMLPAEQFLTGILNKRLGQMLVKYSGVSFSLPAARLREEQIETIAKAVKEFILPVTGTTGLQNAQVTAGGIETKYFDPETMESRLCPGLFAAGEVLDVDGACGGYNLQWAWSSGYLAGRSAAL
jgi:predicted Rossmann fold flavoprotein